MAEGQRLGLGHRGRDRLQGEPDGGRDRAWACGQWAGDREANSWVNDQFCVLGNLNNGGATQQVCRHRGRDKFWGQSAYSRLGSTEFDKPVKKTVTTQFVYQERSQGVCTYIFYIL